MSEIKAKGKRYPREKVFIVNESYAGIKNLSDIFAELLYSAYCKNKPNITGNGINRDSCLPDRTGQMQYGDKAS